MTILAEGCAGFKILGNGKPEIVTPFTGVDSEDVTGSFGIGFILKDRTALFSKHPEPRRMIRSWRAMKILEHIREIEHTTYHACWHAAGVTLGAHESRSLTELIVKLGGKKTFDVLRETVLNSVPPPDLLEELILFLRVTQITGCASELKEEVNAGRLTQTSLIRKFIATEEYLGRNR